MACSCRAAPSRRQGRSRLERDRRHLPRARCCTAPSGARSAKRCRRAAPGLDHLAPALGAPLGRPTRREGLRHQAWPAGCSSPRAPSGSPRRDPQPADLGSRRDSLNAAPRRAAARYRHRQRIAGTGATTAPSRAGLQRPLGERVQAVALRRLRPQFLGEERHEGCSSLRISSRAQAWRPASRSWPGRPRP